MLAVALNFEPFDIHGLPVLLFYIIMLLKVIACAIASQWLTAGDLVGLL